eukprot:40148-Eustigmatos_ZCMA.PRE.1
MVDQHITIDDLEQGVWAALASHGEQTKQTRIIGCTRPREVEGRLYRDGDGRLPFPVSSGALRGLRKSSSCPCS